MISIATNAARIALSATPDGSSTHQCDQIVMAAERLATIEAYPNFQWEDQPNDWESVCALISEHLSREGRVPTLIQVSGFIKKGK